MSADLAFDWPAVLLLLPLAVLPWLADAGATRANTWGAARRPDAASRMLGIALRGAASLAIAALVVALAEPYRGEQAVPRIGRGAEIVILLDRSRSMDQSFGRVAGAPPRGTGPEALDFYMRMRNGPPKGQVARELLARFAASRPDDTYAMFVFSGVPLQALDFTQKPEAVAAAIRAADAGRGLSETHIGQALLRGLGLFEGRAYTGSRIVLLVSDGGDRLDPEERERITELVRRHRVGIYWLYLRSTNSPGLVSGSGGGADNQPEAFLHAFFGGMGTPYRAFEADHPEALAQALAELAKLENLPRTWTDALPRRDEAATVTAVALAALLLLWLAERWRLA